VKGFQLLESAAMMEAFFACDQILSEGCDRGEGVEDAEVAAWYIAACVCTAAGEALSLSVSHCNDVPASVGALAMRLALSKPFLAAASQFSELSPNYKYVKAAAKSALEIANAAALSDLATKPIDHNHPWVCGNDYLEMAVSFTGQNARQLLLLARDQLRTLQSSAVINNQSFDH
jgi:hypothetical protein